MNKREFDRHLKDRLDQFESKYSSRIWENIEVTLDENKPKRALPYFPGKLILLAGSLILILGAAAYNFYLKPSINQQYGQAISKLNGDIKPSADNYSDQAYAEQLPQNKNEFRKTIASLSAEKQDSKDNTSYSELRTFKATSGYNKSAPKISTAISINQNEMNQKQLETAVNIANTASNTANTNVLASNIRSISTEKMMSVNSENNEISLADFFLNDPKGKCPKFNTNVPQYFIEAFMGPQFNTNIFAAKDPEYEVYKGIRKNSESALPGYNIGFNVGMEFRNGFLLKSGMIFSNLRNRLDFKQNNVEILKYKVVPSDTIHGNGTVAYVFDTIAYIEKGVRTIRHYNSVKSIEIPLWVGYQKEYLRWSIALNAGLSFQLHSIQTGKVISHTALQEPVEYTNTVNGHYNLYKRTFGFAFMASSQIGYKIGSNYQLYFEPNLRYYPASITVDAHPLKQHLFAYGLNLGVKLGF